MIDTYVVVAGLTHQTADHAAQSPLTSLWILPTSTLDLRLLIVAPRRRIGNASRVQELCSLALVVASRLPSFVDGLRLLWMDLPLCEAGVGPRGGGRVRSGIDVKVCLVAGIELSDPWESVSCCCCWIEYLPWRGKVSLVTLGSWRCHCAGGQISNDGREKQAAIIILYYPK